jgi:hypothetical protein
MKRELKYPLTIFINVDSQETRAELCPASIAAQTVCFAVWLEDGKPVLKAEGTMIRMEKKLASD